MTPSIAHGWEEETPEAKARWIQSLSPEVRMNVFVEWMELIFALNPQIADHIDAHAIAKGFHILSRE